MPEIAVKIDDQYVPLAQCDWVFREPCGCPFGVMSAVTHSGQILAADEDAAWREFYDTARERNAARKQGVTAELMTHERYGHEVMPLMRGGSGHVCGKAVA